MVSVAIKHHIYLLFRNKDSRCSSESSGDCGKWDDRGQKTAGSIMGAAYTNVQVCTRCVHAGSELYVQSLVHAISSQTDSACIYSIVDVGRP